MSGAAHVANVCGTDPETPDAWGWRAARIRDGDSTKDVWREQGARIGWLDGAYLYLDPTAAYAVAQRMRGILTSRSPSVNPLFDVVCTNEAGW